MPSRYREQWIVAAVLAALAMHLAPGSARASCGSAFCSLSTDWNLQGVWTEPGMRVDARYESIDQDQPTAGNRSVAVGALPRDHNEVQTLNQNLLVTVDYAFSEAWSVSAGIPVVDRSHKHVEVATHATETWHFTELGDMRIMGRYQPENSDLTSTTAIGLNFGLKLPTGRTDVSNAQGEKAERTLQPGTGTTDLLFGAYLRKRLGLASMLFLQGLWQNALDMRNSYQPGARVTADAGYRINVTGDLALIVQFNALLKGIDGGAQADPQDSGATFLYLSPGASYALGDSVQVYAFYQQPVYQYVNGLQLTARDSYAVGTSARF
jgi:hypothetical protein